MSEALLNALAKSLADMRKGLEARIDAIPDGLTADQAVAMVAASHDKLSGVVADIQKALDVASGASDRNGDAIALLDKALSAVAQRLDAMQQAEAMVDTSVSDIKDAMDNALADIAAQSNAMNDDTIGLISKAVDNLNARIDTIALTHGKDGADGKDGQDGEKGEKGDDGAGIITRQWAAGVYRKEAIVQHHLGQYFIAKEDTANEPGSDDSWARLGTAGLCHKGAYNESADYGIGDLYVKDYTTHLSLGDGKSVILAYRGAKGVAGERGEIGLTGATGEAGATIKNVFVDDGALVIEMTDGNFHVAEKAVDISDIASQTKALLDDALGMNADDIKPPIVQFTGIYQVEQTYKRGDVVRIGADLAVCYKAHAKYGDFDKSFILMIAGNGGGVGGGGSFSGFLTQDLDANNFRVVNLNGPRSGASGAKDAVNRETMDKAIAAGSLYHGTYAPATNAPNLWTITDSKFVPPVAGVAIAKPAGAQHTTAATDISVWFDIGTNGLDTFPATVSNPIRFEFSFSDGSFHHFMLNPQTFQDRAALRAELQTLAIVNHVPLSAVGLDVSNGHLWLSADTTAPLYATSLSVAIGGGFPAAAIGAGNTALNTYNWIVQTRDPNVPEPALPGIPGLPAGSVLRNSDILQFNGVNHQFEVIRGGQLTQAFADNRYWQVKGNNFEWRDDSYPKGAVVLYSNVWYQASQQIVVGDHVPSSVAAATKWRKINTSHGVTTFFGQGDWVMHPVLDAANNWGMPIGTTPSGQQPESSDVYYDLLTGSVTVFTVVKNAPVAGQSVPDTVTGDRTWGFARNMEWTTPTGAAAGQTRTLVGYITDDPQLLDVVIREVHTTGAIYKFTVEVSGSDSRIAPSAVLPEASMFSKLSVVRMGTDNHAIVAELSTRYAPGRKFEIEINSSDQHLDELRVGNTTGAIGPSYFDASKTYPSDELLAFLRADPPPPVYYDDAVYTGTEFTHALVPEAKDYIKISAVSAPVGNNGRINFIAKDANNAYVNWGSVHATHWWQLPPANTGFITNNLANENPESPTSSWSLSGALLSSTDWWDGRPALVEIELRKIGNKTQMVYRLLGKDANGATRNIEAFYFFDGIFPLRAIGLKWTGTSLTGGHHTVHLEWR